MHFRSGKDHERAAWSKLRLHPIDMTLRKLAYLTLLLLVAAPASAQVLRLNLYGGYTFRDRFPLGGTYQGFTWREGAINESAHFGGGLEYEFRPNKAIEVYYQMQPTTGYIETSLGRFTTDVTANYLMLGGLGYAPFNDKLKGFGGLLVGAGWASSDAGSSTKFAWGGRLGLMISPSERVGIKLGAQVLSPIQGASGGLYLGAGTGGVSTGAGISTYSSIYQFGFFGALTFSFPQ